MPSATGLSTEAWYIVTFVIALASGIIGYFLQETMKKVDTHDKDINLIKQTYVTDTQMKEVKQDFEDDLEKLALDVVDVKKELSDDIRQLTLDVADIKDNFLKTQDFYRVQANTDKKLDKMYDLLLKLSGGAGNG